MFDLVPRDTPPESPLPSSVHLGRQWHCHINRRPASHHACPSVSNALASDNTGLGGFARDLLS